MGRKGIKGILGYWDVERKRYGKKGVWEGREYWNVGRKINEEEGNVGIWEKENMRRKGRLGGKHERKMGMEF